MELAWFNLALEGIARGFEAAGVLVILAGLVYACWRALHLAVTRAGRDAVYHQFRTTLARGILLGLEFLVAADIIGTVALEATLQNLAVLGLIVVIRTFLSISLEVEITGRFPWQQPAKQPEIR